MTTQATPTPGPYAETVKRLAATVAASENIQQTLDEAAAKEPVTDTDAAILQKVGAFLDPAYMGPIFLSEAIRGKHYVIRYPRFVDVLDAQLITSRTTIEGGNQTLNNLKIVMGEMLTNAKGWIPAHDEGKVATLRNNLHDEAKWPKLKDVHWLDSRDPGLGSEIAELAVKYIEWKRDVTPTEEEFSKYYATAD